MKVNESTLAAMTEVIEHCRGFSIEPLLIGAVALAARGYPRFTEDVDLAVAVPFSDFERLAGSLEKRFQGAVLSPPDGDDPLGGVITIQGFGHLPIQLVNFDNSPSGGFPRLVRDALERAEDLDESRAKLPLAEDLIFFKLYAGGPKSKLDILELMTRTRVDLDELRTRAAAYRMSSDLETVLALLQGE